MDDRFYWDVDFYIIWVVAMYCLISLININPRWEFIIIVNVMEIYRDTRQKSKFGVV